MKPVIDMCLPPRRSYMVLHLRRGDRLNLHLATDAFEASFGMSRAMFAAMIHAAKQAQPLPVLILLDPPTTRRTHGNSDALMSEDIRVIDRAPCASLDEWAAPPSLQSHHEPSVQKSTLDAIRDWFLIWNAVGVVVDVGTPWGNGASGEPRRASGPSRVSPPLQLSPAECRSSRCALATDAPGSGSADSLEHARL